MKRTFASLCVVGGMGLGAAAMGQVNLYLVKVGGLEATTTQQVLSDPNNPDSPLVTNPDNRFWIGQIPSAIAYGKGNLFVAGSFNGGTVPLDGDDADGDLNTAEASPFNVSVVRIGSILTTPVLTKLSASRVLVANTRGYVGGDYRGDVAGGQVVFSFDSGASGTSKAISVYGNVDGTMTPTIVNQISSGTGYRGSAGPAFDFGPTGAGFPSISGRPAIAYMLLNDGGYFGFDPNNLTATYSSPVYGPLDYSNPLTNDTSGNALHRDIDVNPTTGLMVSISSGAVRVATRNSDGSTTAKPYSPIGMFTSSADQIVGQHVNILNGFPGGDRIIWNRRVSTAAGQGILSVIKMNQVDTGAAETINFIAADGTALVLGTGPGQISPDGTGWYDFAWEKNTSTLVILDSASKKYYVMSPEQPGACCVGTACFVINASNCTSETLGGVAGDPGSACEPDGCQSTASRCCLRDGSCQVLDATACAIVGGVVNAATTCTPNPCPQATTERCCVGARCAIVSSASACTALISGSAGGVFAGSASTCNAAGVFNGPCCFADYNKAGGITVQDVFDFLTDWFSSNPNANVAGDGAPPTVQDVFDFLTAWFSGGC